MTMLRGAPLALVLSLIERKASQIRSNCIPTRQLYWYGYMNIFWYILFDFIECFTTTFLRAHSWLHWVVLIHTNFVYTISRSTYMYTYSINMINWNVLCQFSKSAWHHFCDSPQTLADRNMCRQWAVRYAYGIVSSARWVYLSTSLRNLSRAFRRVKDRRPILHEKQCHMHFLARFQCFVHVFIFFISFFTRVRDGFISDLVSKWGVCFGVRESTCNLHVRMVLILLHILSMYFLMQQTQNHLSILRTDQEWKYKITRTHFKVYYHNQ